MKEQEDKSPAHIALQPKNMQKNSVQLIMAHDLAGFSNNDIALALDLTPGRVSIIKGSPLYKEERQRRWKALQDMVVAGKATEVLEDPARKIINDARETAAKKLVALVTDAKNEFLQKSSAVDVLEFGGIYKDKKASDRTGPSIVIEEKIAARFGFAKDYVPPTIERTITINAA